MPYVTDGTLTTDKRTVDDTTTWDTQTDWEAFQSKNNTVVSNGAVQLEQVPAVPDSQNLYAQYVADDINVSDGDAVTTWPDSSGNGRDATGGSPTYVTGALNGKPVVSFDGADDVLDTGITWDTTTSRSLYIVMKVASGDTGVQYGAIDRSGTKNRTQFTARPGGNYWHNYADFINTLSGPDSAFHVHSQVSGGGSSELFENSSSIDTASYNGVGALSVTDRIGARYDTGAGGVTDHSNCEIAEILLYQADHTSATRQDVWNYLNDKHAVF